MRKSVAAVGIDASSRVTSSEYTDPVGLEYFGTVQMPLIDGSFATSSLATAMSGPSGLSGTTIISMPSSSVIAKCRS